MEHPNRGGQHHRAQSETFICFADLDDDILLDDVIFGLPPAPSLSSEATTPQFNIGPQTIIVKPAGFWYKLSLLGSMRRPTSGASPWMRFFEGLNFGLSTSSSVNGTGVFSMTGAVDDRKTTSVERLQETALNVPKEQKDPGNYISSQMLDT